MKLSVSAKKAIGEMVTVGVAAAATAIVSYASSHLGAFDVPLLVQPAVLALLAGIGRYISQKFKHPDPQ
ncbi:MAG: hypothetical protein PHT33_09800 [bacterium]|nr:hypothetical protein [bacterium]